MRLKLPISGPLDLEATFSCGQAFRWRRDADGPWTGIVGGAELRVLGVGDGVLTLETTGPSDAASLERYFRLDENPEGHVDGARELLAIPGFVPLLGLRLLRQDPWETLASFICSAAANIGKISANVEAVASRHGTDISGSERRAFPGPLAIARARESDLRRAGVGFRAPYLLGTAKRVAEDPDAFWARLRSAPLEEARDELTSLPGVGPKIADCVLLFGLDRLEAYPVDRWIRRATRELMARPQARDEELARWAVRLGPGRGYLQQVLFHLRRTSGPFPSMAALRRRAAG
ncbi:MAG TPA: DNA glycosylase [Candidatus Eisenbacteria bacterium]|nr:DNA glycosylase [Candidatus Eisenbacteria bacterium]